MLSAARQICLSLGITQRAAPAAAAAAGSLSRRWASTSADDAQAAMDKINEKFVEARDEIAYAQEDAGTTYFNESYDDAAAMVSAVLTEWEGLLGRLDEQERGKAQRVMGLKMAQLTAELKELDSLHD